MGAKQVIVKKTTVTRKRAYSSGKSTPKGKGQKRCPTCGKFM